MHIDWHGQKGSKSPYLHPLNARHREFRIYLCQRMRVDIQIRYSPISWTLFVSNIDFIAQARSFERGGKERGPKCSREA